MTDPRREHGSWGALRALGGLMVPLALVGCAPAGSGSASAADLAPARLGGAAVAARAEGCWELSWAVREGVAGTTMVSMPDSVQLRGAPVFGTPERVVSPATHPTGRRADPAAPDDPPPWESRFRINRWWTEDDALRIRFSDGEDLEWNVSLALNEESRGEGSGYGPDGGLDERSRLANVAARRISCDIG